MGKSCEPMSASEQARLIEERRGSDWSAEPAGRAGAAVSPLALAAARQMLRTHPDPQRQAYGGLSDADLLRTLGVTTSDGE